MSYESRFFATYIHIREGINETTLGTSLPAVPFIEYNKVGSNTSSSSTNGYKKPIEEKGLDIQYIPFAGCLLTKPLEC